MISLQSKSHSDLNDHPNAEVSARGTCKSTTAKDSPDIATGKRVRKQPDGPLRGTRSHYKGSARPYETIVSKLTKRLAGTETDTEIIFCM